MQKRILVLMLVVSMVALGAVFTVSAEEGSWTGEVIDVACYVPKGAAGADHAGCAQACVKGGQPMGLLLEDGTVVILAANHDNGDSFAALKDMAGGNAEVTGDLADKGGVKVLTVSGAKAAS